MAPAQDGQISTLITPKEIAPQLQALALGSLAF